MIERLRELWRASATSNPAFAAALAQRWSELPDVTRTPGQLLGTRAVGCEATHGVFPKCNLACTPCYHSRDANAVRVDGAHTLAQVEAQMRMLHERRGPNSHAQLIGGEVSLLAPDDHAAALQIMQRYGREPMSFTHGDFDYEHLRAIAIGPDGERRLDRLSFAVHFDITMKGRRGIEQPRTEADLHPHRLRFAENLARLQREEGVRHFIAHNMTVTPDNLDQVADVIRTLRTTDYGLLSFQPAAYMGDKARWREGYRDATPDEVWAEIERGAGRRLDYHLFEHGDVRCNRVSYGAWVGDRYVPVLDADDARDVRVRDLFIERFGGFQFSDVPPHVLALRLVRHLARHPVVVPTAFGWLVRATRRAGVRNLLRHRRVHFVTLVLHQFMDAADVEPAWAMLQRGEQATDARLRETQERLSACAYTMAHPENGTLVPACVQHGVLDPVENRKLRRLLPVRPAASR